MMRNSNEYLCAIFQEECSDFNVAVIAGFMERGPASVVLDSRNTVNKYCDERSSGQLQTFVLTVALRSRSRDTIDLFPLITI